MSGIVVLATGKLGPKTRAASVAVADAAGYFTATNVEDALEESVRRSRRVFTPEFYADVELVNTTTDATSAIQAAWDAAEAVGGVVMFKAGVYRVLGALSLARNALSPYDSGPTKWEGVGADKFSPEVSTRDPSGGTILDLRYSTGPACIDLRGSGHWECEGITFWQNGTAHTNPYIQTTNTTIHVHDCTFFGHNTKLTTLCDQDAIILGGTTQTIGTGSDAPFQGYGTVINNNHFQRIRRAVYGRTYCNGVVVRDNNIWHLCGSSVVSQVASIEFLGVSSSYCTGNVIAGNLIEMSGYVYGIKLAGYCLGTSLVSNNFYDFNGSVLAPIRLESTAINNVVLAGYAATTVAHVSAASSNNLILHSNGNGTDPVVISQPVTLTSDSGNTMTNILAVGAPSGVPVKVQPSASKSDAASLLTVLRSAAEASNPGTTVMDLLQRGELVIGGANAGRIIFKDAAGTEVARFDNALGIWKRSGTGGNMEINSGTGGSYCDMKHYGVRYYDHTGTLQMTYGAGGANLNAASGQSLDLKTNGTSRIKMDGTGIGFFAATPAAKPTVTGSRGGNAALASLITALATLGLVTDSSTA